MLFLLLFFLDLNASFTICEERVGVEVEVEVVVEAEVVVKVEVEVHKKHHTTPHTGHFNHTQKEHLWEQATTTLFKMILSVMNS